MRCNIEKIEIETFHVFKNRALLNKPITSPSVNGVADMHLGYNKNIGHITSILTSKEDLGSLQEKIYKELYKNYAPVGLSGMQKKFTEFVGNWLGSFVSGSNKKILEVGCHDGSLLKILKEMGHKCVGVEPSPCAEYGVINFDLDIRQSFYHKEMFQKGEFDIIILRHVLEHVTDPVEFLEDIGYALKEGGLLYVEVPNSKWSFENFYFPEFHVDHISYFSMNSLTRLLYKAGFEDKLHIEEFSAYMKFPFLSVLVSKKKITCENENINIFQNFRIKEQLENFCNKYRIYKNNLNNLKKIGKIGVWGSGSIGTQYAIDAEWTERDAVYVDPNPNSEGLKLSVTGHQIYNTKKLLEKEIEIVLIASGWENDSIAQARNIIPSKKIITFSDLLVESNG